MTIIEEVALIRKRIRRECKTLSVRNGNGTAYGWVDIASGTKGNFTEQEKAALKVLGLSYGGNYCVISRDERALWAHYLEQDPNANYTYIAADYD